jgi:hypothetical protein
MSAISCIELHAGWSYGAGITAGDIRWAEAGARGEPSILTEQGLRVHATATNEMHVATPSRRANGDHYFTEATLYFRHVVRILESAH